MIKHVSFGRWLQQRRKSLDLTQSALADCIGCARPTLQKIELGQRRPSLQLAERLRAPLGIPEQERELFLRAARAGVAPGAGAAAALELLDAPDGTEPLPAPAAGLIGREREILTLCALLRRPDVRLVTLSGPGGVGKTRLALQIAAELRDDFPGGATFSPLAAVRDPGLLLSSLAHALGLAEVQDKTLLQVLGAHLARRRALLILDNLEHLAGAAPLLGQLLELAPGLSLLVTSRVVLQIYGEHEFPVQPLQLPDLRRLPASYELAAVPAVALFLARARAARPGFALGEESAPQVAAICVRLEGLPLALELAASWVKLFTLGELLSRLEQRLMLLSGGPLNLPERLRSLRSTIDWSYSLLDPSLQALFARLSLFVGGFNLQAVQALCAEEALIVEGANAQRSAINDQRYLEELRSLLNQSLLYQLGESHDGMRFGMLETIREYAEELLDALPQAQALRRRHALYFRDLAQSAEAHLWGGEQGPWLERLDQDYDNLRAARQWAYAAGEHALVLELGVPLVRFWMNRGYLKEGIQWIETGLEGGDTLPATLRAKGLRIAGAMLNMSGQGQRAMPRYQQALALSLELGEPEEIARSNLGLGTAYRVCGDYAAAQGYFEHALALHRANADLRGAAYTMHFLADAATACGDYARAERLLEESLEIRREFGDQEDIGMIYVSLGHAALGLAEHARAYQRYAEALRLTYEVRAKHQIMNALYGLSALLLADQAYQDEQQRAVRAARMLGAAQSIHEEIGSILEREERELCARARAQSQALLEPAAWQAAWATGAGWGLDLAVDQAQAMMQVLSSEF